MLRTIIAVSRGGRWGAWTVEAEGGAYCILSMAMIDDDDGPRKPIPPIYATSMVEIRILGLGEN